MTLRIEIVGPWIDLNTYIDAERSNRFKAAKLKREEMDRIMWQLPAVSLTGKHRFTFSAYVKNRKKDPDNIYAIFIKFFFDALVKKEILENDGQRHISSISLAEVQLGEERMEVLIEGVE